MEILIFFVAHWYLSLFAQSFFHHRYSAHQMFTMNKFTEKIFFIFSFVVQGSSYMSPKVYGAMHRMHHAHADTEKDPHSPKFSSNLVKQHSKKRSTTTRAPSCARTEAPFVCMWPCWIVGQKLRVQNVGDNNIVRLFFRRYFSEK